MLRRALIMAAAPNSRGKQQVITQESAYLKKFGRGTLESNSGNNTAVLLVIAVLPLALFLCPDTFGQCALFRRSLTIC